MKVYTLRRYVHVGSLANSIFNLWNLGLVLVQKQGIVLGLGIFGFLGAGTTLPHTWGNPLYKWRWAFALWICEFWVQIGEDAPRGQMLSVLLAVLCPD